MSNKDIIISIILFGGSFFLTFVLLFIVNSGSKTLQWHRRRNYKEDFPKWLRWYPKKYRLSSHFEEGDIFRRWGDDWVITCINDEHQYLTATKPWCSHDFFIDNDYDFNHILIVNKKHKEVKYDPSQQKDEEDDI